jgi:hypothetical protein
MLNPCPQHAETTWTRCSGVQDAASGADHAQEGIVHDEGGEAGPLLDPPPEPGFGGGPLGGVSPARRDTHRVEHDCAEAHQRGRIVDVSASDQWVST